MASNSLSFWWIRRDIRLEDNAPLYRALKSGLPVQPVFVFDRSILDELPTDDRRVTFIWHHINQLAEQLWRQYGCALWVRYGYPVAEWGQLLTENPGSNIFAGQDYEPSAIARDEQVAALSTQHGGTFHLYKEHVVFHFQEVLSQQGRPYTVYTPYSKAWKAKLATGVESDAASALHIAANRLIDSFYLKPYPTGKYLHRLHRSETPPAVPSLPSMGFQAVGEMLPATPPPAQLINRYDAQRDFPALKGTSQMSVHLRFGTVGIRALVRQALALGTEGSQKYLNELIWREFYSHVLQHFPHTVTQNFRPEFDRVRWRNNEEEFERWCQGQTGYPMVDAGMRELNATGYMHNRARMVTASFLTKHLLCDWRMGEAYFAQKLLDFDLAQNVGGWQWAAGTGTDAAPYFRIFNPAMQAEKFDPQHQYIRKWVPEFGTSRYVQPIVDHQFARDRCLEAYKPLGK